MEDFKKELEELFMEFREFLTRLGPIKKLMKKWQNMSFFRRLKFLIILTIEVILVAVFIAFVLFMRKGPVEEPEPIQEPVIITSTTLKEIVEVSDLSTFTAVYNGVAKGMNPKKKDKPDYYVSYEATVKAGINLADVEITVDNTEKSIYVSLPDAYITETNVDIASLDYIFYNTKADTPAITQEAYRLCQEDVERETIQQRAIYTLAQQNAVNVITALIKPFVEELDEEYTLVVE